MPTLDREVVALKPPVAGRPASTNTRLVPSRWSSRYYILTLIRDALSSVLDTCLRARPGKTVVDFGCGTAPYRPLVEGYGGSYVGVDLPHNLYATIHMAAGITTPLPAGYADVVLSTQVLEHVDDPAAYLRECHRVLQPDGVLVLSTHGYWIYHPDPHDLWRWTGEGLRRIVAEAGFEPESMRGLMGVAPSAVYLFQDAVASLFPRFARPLFWFGMQALARALDRLHSEASRAADACVFIIVARKQPAGHGGVDG
jgi:SAM-dependent methyltransferase